MTPPRRCGTTAPRHHGTPTPRPACHHAGLEDQHAMTTTAANATGGSAATRTDDRAARLMLIGMAICFGGTWVAADIAVAAAPPFTIAAVRFGVASVLL